MSWVIVTLFLQLALRSELVFITSMFLTWWCWVCKPFSLWGLSLGRFVSFFFLTHLFEDFMNIFSWWRCVIRHPIETPGFQTYFSSLLVCGDMNHIHSGISHHRQSIKYLLSSMLQRQEGLQQSTAQLFCALWKHSALETKILNQPNP